MLGEIWPDQYKRLQRSFALLQRATDQSVYHEEFQQPDAARDILFRFCSDALNLRDWIQKSTNLSQAVRDDVRHLFRSSTQPQSVSVALAACADIANGSKHFVLTHPPYSTGAAAEVIDQVQGAKLPFILGETHLGANHWKIDIGGVEHDALELATQAIADWDAWLSRYGLLPLPA